MNKHLKGTLFGLGLMGVLLYFGTQFNERYRLGQADPAVYAAQVAPQNNTGVLSECDPRYILPAAKPSRVLRPGEQARFEDVSIDPRVTDPRATGECERNPDFYGWHKGGK